MLGQGLDTGALDLPVLFACWSDHLSAGRFLTVFKVMAWSKTGDERTP